MYNEEFSVRYTKKQNGGDIDMEITPSTDVHKTDISTHSTLIPTLYIIYIYFISHKL